MKKLKEMYKNTDDPIKKLIIRNTILNRLEERKKNKEKLCEDIIDTAINQNTGQIKELEKDSINNNIMDRLNNEILIKKSNNVNILKSYVNDFDMSDKYCSVNNFKTINNFRGT